MDIEMKLNEPKNESMEKYSSNESDEEMKDETINKKRKGRKITNTRIHPYKIYKYNQGGKKVKKNNNIQKIKKVKNNYRKWADN